MEQKTNDTEIKCTECGKVSIPDRSKWGCEPDLCDDCLAKGWVDVESEEGKELLKNDPELNSLILRKSPYVGI